MRTVAVILNIAFFGSVWIVWGIAGFAADIAAEYWFWLVVFLLYPVINVIALSRPDNAGSTDS